MALEVRDTLEWFVKYMKCVALRVSLDRDKKEKSREISFKIHTKLPITTEIYVKL